MLNEAEKKELEVLKAKCLTKAGNVRKSAAADDLHRLRALIRLDEGVPPEAPPAPLPVQGEAEDFPPADAPPEPKPPSKPKRGKEVLIDLGGRLVKRIIPG